MNQRAHDDATLARKALQESATLKVVAVKDGVVLDRGEGRGIQPLLGIVDRQGEAMAGASVADRVIGQAAAVVLICAGVHSVYGETLSAEAEGRLQQAGIAVDGGERVPYILRRDRTGRCPMEQQVIDVADAGAAVARLRRFIADMK